jgi:hypothetical protein
MNWKEPEIPRSSTSSSMISEREASALRKSRPSVERPILSISWEPTQFRRSNILCNITELQDLWVLSIPAMEHSTVTSWGRDREEDSFRNMLTKHAKPGGLVACVSDSFDIYAACKLWGTKLKDDVIKSGATIVVRPDSGDPAQ